MHPSLQHLEHRPWPLPAGAWTWRQAWCDLLFLHWPVEEGLLRDLLPDGLELDTFEGQAWIGVVPFRMEGVMRRPLPDLPGISAFPELNVRTYVRVGDRHGVWFFSLDATKALAVWAARTFFHLPYHQAVIGHTSEGEGVRFRSVRRSDPATLLEVDYQPVGETYASEPGSLEHWLTERYCLYAAAPDGGLLRTDVHHAPWPLQRAEVELKANTMLEPVGVPTPTASPLAHFSRGVEVVVWDPEKVI